MKHFEDVLEIIGGRNIRSEKETTHWEFWTVQFPTPAGIMNGHYLYLKAKCPKSEANATNIKSWHQYSGNKAYDIVVTPRSSHAAEPDNTKYEFKGERVITSKELIENSLLINLEKKIMDEDQVEPHFVDPTLVKSDESKINDGALEYLVDWFIPKAGKKGSLKKLGVLRADAGVGKTTLARMLQTKINRRDRTIVPILVESKQWRSLLSTDLQLSTIWEKAIAQVYQKPYSALADESHFAVLLREGIFVVIFDGFDELCFSTDAGFTPIDLINEFLEMLGSEETPGQARILLTTRETFWKNIEEGIDKTRVDLFRLQGFTNDQQKKYFEKRLQNSTERDIAFRLASEIGGKKYTDISTEEFNAARLSGNPFVLHMIADIVRGSQKHEFNPYAADPFYSLIKDVCIRENERQKLNISPEKQLELFEELFREYNDEIDINNLRTYAQIICDVKDERVIQSLSNHFFLTRLGKDKFAPKHEVLKVYFIAKYLAEGLRKLKSVHRREIAKVLSQSSAGDMQVVDWIVNQLENLDRNTLSNAIKHANEIIHDSELIQYKKSAGKSLFDIVCKLIRVQDKKERTHKLAEYYGASVNIDGHQFEKMIISGHVKSFDFRQCIFRRCYIIDADFKNCIFDQETQFENCVFEGALEVKYSEGVEQIKIVNCDTSKESQLLFDKYKKVKSKPEILTAFAEEAMEKALKKFKRPYGLKTLEYANRLKGIPTNNPFASTVWDILEANKVVERNEISGTSEVGLHISTEPTIRREVLTYFDSGYQSPTLKKVIYELANR